ncbi:MAG: InlB B-repeat-containing protein [Clostridiales bacterium]|nr:InlB B-repeat-containing protein [Clostridiales bacterium]
MKKRVGMIRKLAVFFLTAAMCATSVPVSAAENTDSSGTDSSAHYDGEYNMLDDEGYEAFGFNLTSPDEFDPDDTSNPLEDYEKMVISELYVGDMNREDSWTGSFRVMNDVDTLSEETLSFESMEQDLVGNEYSYSAVFPENKSDYEVQTTNSAALDYDGDGKDEIVEVTLYVNKKTTKDTSYFQIRLYDLNESDEWEVAAKTSIALADSTTDDLCWVDSIEADNSKAYTSIATGDYDSDGTPEIAVYVPSQTSSGAYIQIMEVPVGQGFCTKSKIYLSEFNINGNVFDYEVSGRLMPVVSLSTTSISGQDDLVVNISQPQTSSDSYDEHGQESVLAIYHCYGSLVEERLEPMTLTYGSQRMRFCSAADADINGNGTEELLVGGYLNEKWDDNTDVGSLSDEYNLIQAFCWNGTAYEEVWETPQQVQALSDLKLSTEMMEPAAFAAGQLSPLSNKDYVFLEGVISVFSASTSSAGTSEKGLLEDGIFSFECETALKGDNSAFISQAYTAVFSSSGVGSEQLVILQGDHRGSDNDVIHYDICWAWYEVSTEDASAGITSAVTDNDYITADEDDNGTFISICPLDCDDDAVYFEYEGKECGWSSPELYTVLQSAPYWSELQYNSETFGVGSTSYELSIGSGSGTSGDSSVEVGGHVKATFLVGVGLLGNKGEGGIGFDIDGMIGYMHEYEDTVIYTDSYNVTVRAGEDCAIVMVIPVVSYNYSMWYPTFTVDADYIDAYNELVMEQLGLDDVSKLTDEQKCPYTDGQVVEGHWEKISIPVQLNPVLTDLTVEEYNELAAEYDLDLISEDLLTETPGDPTTYQQSTSLLEAQEESGTIESLHVSTYSAEAKQGETETELKYEIENETVKGNGIAAEVKGELFAATEEEVTLFAAEKFEAEVGLAAGADASYLWTSTSLNGQSFTGKIMGIPEGGNENYVFSTRLAVYAISDDSDLNGVHVVQYIVEGVTDATAPPQVAANLRVVGTTEHAVVLAWDTPASRVPGSYEVYEKTGTSGNTLLNTTEDTYYVVTNLQPGTTYEFAVKSYYGGLDAAGKCTGVASALSRYVEATTKSSDVNAPTITKQPESVVADPSEYGTELTMTVEARVGEGLENQGYTLSYQWYQLAQKETTNESVWEKVEDATSETLVLPTITEANAGDYTAPVHYMVEVTQQKGGDVKSVCSQVASLYVTGDGKSYVGTDLGIELSGNVVVGGSEDSGSGSSGDFFISMGDGSGEYYTGTGAKPEVSFTLKTEDEEPIAIGGGTVTVVYREDGAESAQTTTGTLTDDGTLSVTLNGEDGQGLAQGDYEIYGVYAGQTAEGGNVHYLASQSDTLTLHVVDTYEITYHMNGGINSTSNPTMLTNESAAVTLTDPTKTYYTFGGWYLNEALTEELDKVDNSYVLSPEILAAHGGDIDLYAAWTPVEFTITYELNGGTNNAANPTAYTAETGMITLKDPSRDGYDFDGWYRDADLTDGPVSSLSGIYEDITLYAKWVEAEDDNGDNDDEDDPLDQNAAGEYLISSYDDLVTMAKMIQKNPENYASASYKQTCNINCGEATWNLALGTDENPFNGTYDGNDFYILGLKAGKDISGLFGVIGKSGTVKNLMVVDFDYSESVEVAGGIAGVNKGTIDGCGSGINITSAATVFRNGEEVPISTLNSDVLGTIAGGIAGRNEGTIKNSRSNASVTASETAGGIAGINEGSIINVYNTGAVTGTETAGGIVGKNESAGSIRYGYNCRIVSGTVAGGIAGSSENGNITDLWYLEDSGKACGDKADTALNVEAMTASEMKTEDFAQVLNEAIADEQSQLDLMVWNQSSSKNEGYPMMERATLVQQTLTSDELEISVSGRIHEGAQLSLIRLDADSEECAAIRNLLTDGTLQEGWYLALMYADGTYGQWDGDLTITIRPETKALLSELNIVHLNDNGEYTELATENDGESLIVTSSTLGSFAVVLGSTGSTEQEPTESNQNGVENEGTGQTTNNSTGQTTNNSTGQTTGESTDQTTGAGSDQTMDDGSGQSVGDGDGQNAGNADESGEGMSSHIGSAKKTKTGDSSNLIPMVCIFIAAAAAACGAVIVRRRRRRQ